MGDTDYEVGRGKPPLHTRFQKGQSGNPSGKPGPAKRTRDLFAQTLLAELSGNPNDTERAPPETMLALMVRRLAQNAIAGRTSAQRLVLSLLEQTQAEQAAEARAREIEELPSLDELLWPDPERRAEVARLSAEMTADDIRSLMQGKTQGSEKF